jgi:hypothetical protein
MLDANYARLLPKHKMVGGFTPKCTTLLTTSTDFKLVQNNSSTTSFQGKVWQIETVDAEAHEGGTSLTLDSLGRPHIAYYGIDGILKYAWHDGGNWHIETVDGTIYPTNYRMGISLALDSIGQPHIAYVTGYPYHVSYAWNDGKNWHVEGLESLGGAPSMVLDELDRPHLGAGGKYAWHNGTSWQIVTIDSDPHIGFTSLALDSMGHPHLSYCHFQLEGWMGDYSCQELKYAWYDGSDWHTQTIDTGGAYTSLVLDSSDLPHIGYDLKYAWGDRTVWHTQTVDSEISPSPYTSLALDSSAHPHLSYCLHKPWEGPPIEWACRELRYAWHDGTHWHIQTVEYDAGGYTSLVLDSSNQPHISYYQFDHFDIGSLKYARLVPSPSLDKRAFPDNGLHNGDTLTYTLSISAPELRVRLWDPLPTGVYFTGRITNTVLPLAVYSPTINSILWEGTLLTDTVQTITFQVMLNITGTEVLSSTRPIANTVQVSDIQSDWIISATAIVNGSRIYFPAILNQLTLDKEQ